MAGEEAEEVVEAGRWGGGRRWAVVRLLAGEGGSETREELVGCCAVGTRRKKNEGQPGFGFCFLLPIKRTHTRVCNVVYNGCTRKNVGQKFSNTLFISRVWIRIESLRVNTRSLVKFHQQFMKFSKDH
ncbi:hypothetical protein R6Q59_018850 [Mikania micrantha]